MINVNSPKVIMVIGSVSTNKIGRTKAFNIPSTIAATMAMYTPLTVMPGT